MSEVVKMAGESKSEQDPVFEDRKTFKLRRPITVQGPNGPEKISSLTMRYPSGEDLFELGLPYLTVVLPATKGFSVEMDGPKTFAWIERLCQPVRSRGELGKLTAGDVRRIYEWISNETNPGDDQDPVGN